MLAGIALISARSCARLFVSHDPLQSGDLSLQTGSAGVYSKSRARSGAPIHDLTLLAAPRRMANATIAQHARKERGKRSPPGMRSVTWTWSRRTGIVLDPAAANRSSALRAGIWPAACAD